MRQLKINKQITNRNEDSIIRYFQEVSKYPMISLEEEVELAVKIKNGDKIALHKLVEANLRFVISVAKQFQNQGLSLIDLINEGNVGLVTAAGRFDETRGFKFISYAVWWIRQSIMQAIALQTRVVRLPLNRLSSMNKISKAIPYLEQQYEREPSNRELADYLDVSEEHIELNNAIKHRQVSFDKPLFQDGESDFSLYDLVQADDIPSPDNNLMTESMIINLVRVLKRLPKKEAEVIILSYGLRNHRECNSDEIAFIMNVSKERVRQIRNSALYKMKKLMLGETIFHDNL